MAVVGRQAQRRPSLIGLLDQNFDHVQVTLLGLKRVINVC